MLSVTVCSGTVILMLDTATGHHTRLDRLDFSITFRAITLVSLCATHRYLKFAHDADSETSGHRGNQPARGNS